MFRVIKEPEENPIDLSNSYRQQNIIMQKMRMLHTAFDGIKLNHWSDDDRELPDILAGSICEFEGRLFETNQTIKLLDSITENEKDLRFIKLVIHRDEEYSNNDYLTAEIVGGYSSSANDGFPNYDYENRGFYTKENGKIKEKYLRVCMKYSQELGGYVEKKYWNINDYQRKGQILKRKEVTFKAGTHEFSFPDNVNSITVHICSGGGNGGNGSDNGLTSAGGGSGSAAIVTITREMLGASKKVKIIVGSGGNGGTNENNHGAAANGEKGQDGSALIEYMVRGN